MNISSILYKKPGELFNKLAKSKWMQKNLEQGVSDSERFAAAMLVTSIVSKDLVNCAFYTTQSYNNQKIPEEKRKFVAALDLMNGIIMVGGQLLIGKVIDAKVTPKLLSKFTGTIKDAKGVEKTVNNKALLHPDNIKEMAQKAAKNLDLKIDDKMTEKIVKNVTKLCKEPFAKGFGLFAAAIATTAIVKRTIAPLLSTPLAGWFKEKFMDKGKKPEINKDTIEIESKVLAPSYSKTKDNKQEHKLIKAA